MKALPSALLTLGLILAPLSLAAGDPFAEVTSDPFGDDAFAESAPAADAPDDPFASELPEVDDPFAAPLDDADDPFATPEQPDDPLADPDALTPTPDQPEAIDPFTPEGRREAAPEPTRVVSAPDPVVRLVELEFHPNFESARRASAQSGRQLLMLFSGDTATARQFEELLRQPDVAEVLENFELVRINYRENRPFAHRYSVRSFPYIVIINDLGYTEEHLLPTRDRTFLINRLMPYTQALFR